MACERIAQPAGVLLTALMAAWLLFQAAELLATTLYGPAAWPLQVEDGDAGSRPRLRSEHPPVSDAAGFASTAIETGHGKD